VETKKITEASMIKVESTTEEVESKGGVCLAGIIAQKIGITSITSGALPCANAIIAMVFASMTQGNTGFASVGLCQGNQFYADSFGLPFNYAPETVRLYLERLAEEDLSGIIRQLRGTTINLLERSDITPVRAGKRSYCPVDIDTSPMDNSKTKKEGVSCTYKKFFGYHPIFAYIGKEGYMLDCELRPGSQHCQEGTPAFIRLLLGRMTDGITGNPLLFRLDSGNDSLDTLQAILRDNGGNKTKHSVIIKRNRRGESLEAWVEHGKAHGTQRESRHGKTVWTGVAMELHPGCLEEAHCVYECIERTTDRDGTPLLIPDLEVNTWWTNLPAAADTVIALYHDHGTSEQFHSELKHDMGIERMPSGKFNVNDLYLMIAQNAFNVLRFIGQSAKAEPSLLPLKAKSLRMRIGKVISNIISIAVKYVRHAGNSVIKLWEHNPWRPLYQRLDLVFRNM
jgi:hypothetical protein